MEIKEINRIDIPSGENVVYRFDLNRVITTDKLTPLDLTALPTPEYIQAFNEHMKREKYVKQEHLTPFDVTNLATSGEIERYYNDIVNAEYVMQSDLTPLDANKLLSADEVKACRDELKATYVALTDLTPLNLSTYVLKSDYDALLARVEELERRTQNG